MLRQTNFSKSLRKNSKPLAQITGAILTIAALAFIGLEISKSDFNSWKLFFSLNGWMTFIGYSEIYALSLFLVFIAWLLLVDDKFHSNLLTLPKAMKIYASFQVYKYLPTNVMHQVGRYAMLRNNKVRHTTIAWSTLAEAGLIAAAAVIISTMAGGYEIPKIVDLKRIPYLMLLLSFIIFSLCLSFYLAFKKGLISLEKFKSALMQKSQSIVIAFSLHSIFFLISGLILYGIIRINIPSTASLPPISLIIAANAAAWLAGFLTPGAPGGIGIREFILLLTLKPFLQDEIVVSIAAQHRLTTILGDGLFYFQSQILAKFWEGNQLADRE